MYNATARICYRPGIGGRTMDPVKACSTYHAVLSGKAMHHGADGRTALKVYFIDIVGRKEPAKTVWEHSGMTMQDFLARLGSTDGVEGVGFVTAFPHITKVFRFGPEAETVMNVRAWNTRGLAPLTLARSQEYVEFACLAEAAIAAEEFAFWAREESVEGYLAHWCAQADWPIGRHDKLLAYWDA